MHSTILLTSKTNDWRTDVQCLWVYVPNSEIIYQTKINRTVDIASVISDYIFALERSGIKRNHKSVFVREKNLIIEIFWNILYKSNSAYASIVRD